METPSEIPSDTRLDLAPGVSVSRVALRFKYARSGGPGGQNVNKVNSKAELRIRPGDLDGMNPRALARFRTAQENRTTAEGDVLIVADASRSQEANRQDCIDRLKSMVVQSLKEPKIRRKTRPSRSSVDKRIQSKKANSARKENRRKPID